MVKMVAIAALAAGAAAGGWFVAENYDVRELPGIGEWSAGSESSKDILPEEIPVGREEDRIRIASFNLQNLDAGKLNSGHVGRILTDTIRLYDIVALQEISPDDRGVLPKLLEKVNADGRHYALVDQPGTASTASQTRSAFLFDRASVAVDNSTVCLVKDEGRRLRHEPLVAAFIVRGPSPEEAFTFTLINVHTDSENTARELDVLDDVFRAVRDNPRNEDDVILLGDLNVDQEHLGQLMDIPHIGWALSGTPTMVRRTHLADNVLFDRMATVEFTGSAGVLDLMEHFDLSKEQALAVSDHFPIWAEFSIHEGGQTGRLGP